MTRYSKNQYSFIWAIEPFKVPCHLKSPRFELTDELTTKWHLKIDCKNSGPVSLALARESMDEGPDSIAMHFELSFLDSGGYPLAAKNCRRVIARNDSYQCNFFPNAKWRFQSKKSAFRPNGTLTVCCRIFKKSTLTAKPDLCFARTLLKEDLRIFVWPIKEFSLLQPAQKKNFILNPTSTNRITVVFCMTRVKGEEYVNVDVRNSAKNEISTVKIGLLDFEGKVVRFKKNTEIGAEGAQFVNFIKKSVLTRHKTSLLPNDVLTLRIEIVMKTKIVWSGIEKHPYLSAANMGITATPEDQILCYEQNETSSFKQNMRSLLEDAISSDFMLQAGGVSFNVHKNVLSARSPVFKAMFSTDMMEKTSQCVEIPDITANALRDLLSYIYTDSVGELQWETAADLYSAADKYEFLELKEKCAKVLKSAVSESSLGVILNLADMHQDQELREQVEDFLERQGEGFFESDAWKGCTQKNPVLACEMLAKMLCSFRRMNGKCQRKL